MSLPKIKRFIVHFCLPRESNNQKGRLLHASSLFLVSLLLLFYQLTIHYLPKAGVRVLGYAANISIDEVVRLTNDRRMQAGLQPLTINSGLAAAAKAKGEDMLRDDYWAHVAPDGTEPWKFITDAGYRYRFAGENLARDFSNANSTVDAWMASPSHRENLLSPKYREIGIAVVEGDLAGVDTTIVVQMFGTKYSDVLPSVPVAQKTNAAEVAINSQNPSVLQESKTIEGTISPTRKLFISPFNSTRNISLIVVAGILMVMVVDGIIATRKNLARVSGKSFAHISFLGMIAAVILVLQAGKVL